jgi:fructose-1,6-bisphosphatase/inositol monophosphatase family enzyme
VTAISNETSWRATADHFAALAHSVGQRILELQGRARVSQKGPGDLVTEADQLSHELITRELSASYPGVALVMEEQDNAANVPERCIVVDELDGTNVYSRGADEFGLTIALLEAGRPVAGVLHQPAKQQTLVVARGAGAFLNGERLRLDEAARLDDHVAMLEINRSSLPPLGQQQLMAIAGRSLAVRCLGSAVGSALDVLRGRACLYINWHGAKVWDFAAAALAIEEAGGVALSCLGEPLAWDRIPMSVMLAANAEVAAAALSCAGVEWQRADATS